MAFHRLVAAVVTVLGALALLSAPSAAQVPSEPCRVGNALVSVSYQFIDEQDLTSDGRVWALDTGLATFRLYQTGATTFCAATSSRGTFTTFAGESPAGTGTVPAGLTGRFAGHGTLRFVGSFAPQLPTRGFVGTFDANCDQFGCATPIQFGRKYLEVAGPPVPDSFRATYVSRCGVWIQTSEGDRGDIAC